MVVSWQFLFTFGYVVMLLHSSSFFQANQTLVRTKSLDFRHFFYLHTLDNLLPFPYSVRLNVGVSKENQKSLFRCKPFRSQWYTFEHSDSRHWLKYKHAEIIMFCVSQKSQMSEVRIGFCSDFGTVWNPNIQISDIHCTYFNYSYSRYQKSGFLTLNSETCWTFHD